MVTFVYWLLAGNIAPHFDLFFRTRKRPNRYIENDVRNLVAPNCQLLRVNYLHTINEAVTLSCVKIGFWETLPHLSRNIQDMAARHLLRTVHFLIWTDHQDLSLFSGKVKVT